MKKAVSYKQAQQAAGYKSGGKVKKAQEGVVISKKDEKAHPEDFKYITTKERKAGEAALKAKAVKKVAKKAKGGASMGKCKGGC